jgi:S-adenosylmethionine:tRNA ribosyltransferase-isomerase
MMLDRKTGVTKDLAFGDFPGLLRGGDCVILNDSRVLPARLIGRNAEGGRPVETVLLRETGSGRWECLTRPGRKTRAGARLIFGDGELEADVESELAGGTRVLRFRYDGRFMELLQRLGSMPLPPYIRARLDDPERYQTVYSRVVGSAAAPTAGLHFTREMLEDIRRRGIAVEYVTLHVGLGTFRPVRADNIEEHVMHGEYYVIPGAAADAVNAAKARGGRVVAVGTTSCRTLESRADQNGRVDECAGFTDIFIYPGYEFKCVDCLLTNFHLPESTLIMLVSAFAGRGNVLRAYERAVRERYRFFSFGDAMFITDNG